MTSKKFIPAPPPNRDIERGGTVKWPLFSSRRRGELLEQRVSELARRLRWFENQLLGQNQ
jgi:hypothetical protein